MDVKQMHIAVNLELQEIGSNVMDEFGPEEIDHFLTASQEDILRSAENIKSQYATNKLDENEISISDFESLEETFTSNTFRVDDNIDAIHLPGNFRYLLSAMATSEYGDCTALTKGTSTFRSGRYYYPLEFLALDEIANYNQFDIKINGGTIFKTPFPSDYNYPENRSHVIDWVTEKYPNGNFANLNPSHEVYWERYADLYYPNHFIIISQANSSAYIQYDSSTTGLAITATQLSTKKNTTGLESANELIRAGRHLRIGEIEKAQIDPFNKSTQFEPTYTRYRGQVRFYTSDIFVITSVSLKYIRKPQEISLSLEKSCELPERLHSRVVRQAVQKMLEASESPRQQTYIDQVRRAD